MIIHDQMKKKSHGFISFSKVNLSQDRNSIFWSRDIPKIGKDSFLQYVFLSELYYSYQFSHIIHILMKLDMLFNE